MSEDFTPEMHNEQDDFGVDIVTVTGEDGQTYEFERLDAIETEEGDRYLALLPVYDDADENLQSDGEVIIVQVIEDADGVTLAPIEDDTLLDEIAGIFEERLSELYEIDSE